MFGKTPAAIPAARVLCDDIATHCSCPRQRPCDITAFGDSAAVGQRAQPVAVARAQADVGWEGRAQPVRGGSSSVSSTMVDQLLSALLQVAVLLLLVQPLEPSSHPAAVETGSWDVLPQAPEEEDVAPMRDIWLVLEALPFVLGALGLLLRTMKLSWVLGKWLWRRWGEVSEGLRQVGRCWGPGVAKALGQEGVGRGLRVPGGEQSWSAPRLLGPRVSPWAKAHRPSGAEAIAGQQWAQAEPQGAPAEAPARALLAAACARGSPARPQALFGTRGQRQRHRAQQPPAGPSAPCIQLPVLCLAGEEPERLGLCTPELPGPRLLQEGAAAAAGEPCPDEALPAPELPAEASAEKEEAKTTWHWEEEETPLLASPLSLQLQLHSGLAGQGRECVTSAEPGHWDVPAQ